jgi:hypothetical protein
MPSNGMVWGRVAVMSFYARFVLTATVTATRNEHGRATRNPPALTARAADGCGRVRRPDLRIRRSTPLTLGAQVHGQAE